MLRVPVYAVPAFCGENVTLIVQLAPMASEAPQLLVWLNRLPPPPVEMLLMVSAAVPELVSVNANGALVLLAVTAPKLCDVGVRDTAA